MTDPLDFAVTDAEMPVPNHRASEGHVEEPTTKDRPGIFGTRKRTPKATSTMDPRNVKPGKVRKVVPNNPGQFVDRLEEFYGMLAIGVMPFEPEVGMYLGMPTETLDDKGKVVAGPSGARKCAVAWDEAAQRSEAVRNMLDSLLSVSVWGALIAAHAPMALILLKNRTAFGARMDPAAAMEEMLKQRDQV